MATESMNDSIRALFVDNDSSSADPISEHLTRENGRIEVITTSRKDSALKELKNGDIDCVVCGLGTNESIEFLREVRRTDPGLPFILFTRDSSEEVLNEALEAGMTDYLQRRESVSQYKLLGRRIESIVDHRRRTKLSKRKRAGRGMKDLVRMFETVIHSSPVPIVALDSEKRVRIWNREAEETFGWTREEVMRDTIPIITEEESERFDKIHRRLLEGDTFTDIEMRYRTKDGSPIDMSLSAAPLRGAQEDIRAVVSVMIDITERKEREQRLEVLNRVLRHNLRNEMNVVIGRAEVLGHDSSGFESEQAEIIKEKAREIVELSKKARDIEQLLETNRDKWGSVEITDIIRDEVENFERRYPEANIRTHLPDEKRIHGTEAIRVAISNLIENAVEHNDKSEPRVEVSVASNSEGKVEVSVTDNGPGIPQEEVDVLSRKKEDPLSHSSGLGLWTVSWITDRLRGDIRFENTEPEGTTVVMTLLEPEDQQLSP